jgi:uncharacterized damage-inducible protein DinB
LLYHIVSTRHSWIEHGVKDGDTVPDALITQQIQKKDGVKQALEESWARVERVLRDQSSLDATYTRADTGESMTGHWIAFHLLEHDIHHRSDIFHYLALLEIEHPEVDTP